MLGFYIHFLYLWGTETLKTTQIDTEMITAYALRFATVSIMTFLFSLCPVSMAAQAITLQFQLHAYIDDFGTHRGPNKPRLPAYSPNVTLEDHTLHFYYDHPDCTVQLLEGDDVVFEVPFFPYTCRTRSRDSMS